MRVLVVGGGIAGLTSGIALRHAGHEVHLYERSGFTDETGAALVMTSNASRALLAWGLDPVRAHAVAAHKVTWAKPDTMEITRESDGAIALGKAMGAPMYYAHRSDLHEELKRLAVSEGAGKPVEVHLHTKVVDYDPDTPSITLADGSVVVGDLVVVANGVNSTAVQVVLGELKPALPQGFHNFTYRCLISRADVEADKRTKFFSDGGDNRSIIYDGTDTRLLVYPCRNNEVYNVGLYFHQKDPSSIKPEDWRAPTDKKQFLEKASEYHPDLVAVLAKAKDVRLWPLLYRDPIPTYTRGKLVLVGDAAHPMLPHVGQGASMGIEDAQALGVVLVGAQPSQIPERLMIWEKIRLNRSSGIQFYANVGADKADERHAGAAKYIPADKIPKTTEEFFGFVLGYDVIRDSVLHMKEVDPEFSLPSGFFQKEFPSGPLVYPK